MIPILLSFFTTLSRDKPIWVDFIQIAIPVALAAWGFIRAFRAWERQKKREIELLLEQKRFESKLEACKGVWPLLAYMSAWENEKTVFVKRGDKYFYRKQQGADYLKKLPETYLEKGYGLFIPGNVRDNLYHFRGIVYNMQEWARHNSPSGEEVEVNKEEMIKTVHRLFKENNSSLRKMLLESRIEFED